MVIFAIHLLCCSHNIDYARRQAQKEENDQKKRARAGEAINEPAHKAADHGSSDEVSDDAHGQSERARAQRGVFGVAGGEVFGSGVFELLFEPSDLLFGGFIEFHFTIIGHYSSLLSAIVV